MTPSESIAADDEIEALSAQGAALASEASLRLKEILGETAQPSFRFAVLDGRGGAVGALSMPRAAIELLAAGLALQAAGHAVRIVRTVPSRRLLSTQEAADRLQVSRPFLVKEIEAGKLKCTRVGAQRRLTFEEVSRYERDCMQR